MFGCLLLYYHLYAQGKLKVPSDLQMEWDEMKDETSFSHAHAEILIQVVEMYGQPRYQLNHESAR